MSSDTATATGITGDTGGEIADSREPGERKRPDFLDVAGALAGLVLAVIVADILTDGRLISRRLQGLRGRPPGGEPDGHPEG